MIYNNNPQKKSHFNFCRWLYFIHYQRLQKVKISIQLKFVFFFYRDIIQSVSNWCIHSLKRYFSATKLDRNTIFVVYGPGGTGKAQKHVHRSSRVLTNLAVTLSFDERKWFLNCYWKVENVVEVQWHWRIEFGTPPSTRVTITRIRDVSSLAAKI